MTRSDILRSARRAGRAMRLPPREILTTMHAVGILAVVELLIRCVPLPRLSRILGVEVSLEPVVSDPRQLPTAELSTLAHRQLRCTRRVADAWPFSRGPCLRRALVGGHLIRRLHPAVRLGVAGAGDTLLAHAWLEIDGRPLETVTQFNAFQRASTEVPR